MKNNLKFSIALISLFIVAISTFSSPPIVKAAAPEIEVVLARVNGDPFDIACGGIINFSVEDVVTFTIRATDPDGDPVTLSYIASGFAPPITVNPPSFTPPLPMTQVNPGSAFIWADTIVRVGFIRFFATDGQSTVVCDLDWDWAFPVELSSFVSVINGNDVTLNWTTATEDNNARFEIERANVNTENWNKVGTVQGSGNSTTPVSYTFADRGISVGNYNYRLKQIDFNGNYEYHNLSNEVVIGIPMKFDLSQNYPNPFNPSTKIDFELPTDGKVTLSVYDMSGKQVSELINGFKTAGYYSVQFNASNLSSGIYYYKIQYAGDKSFTKVMKMALVK